MNDRHTIEWLMKGEPAKGWTFVEIALRQLGFVI
jgi:hypothetical protein